MSKVNRKSRVKLKDFEVAYCVEQGFAITVKAHSADEAESVVERRLDDEMDVLNGSRRVHYDGFTVSAEEVPS
jgi:hypothetical protein